MSTASWKGSSTSLPLRGPYRQHVYSAVQCKQHVTQCRRLVFPDRYANLYQVLLQEP
jgi:hypothetical protein